MFRTSAVLFAHSAAALTLAGMLGLGLQLGAVQHAADGGGDPGTSQTDPGQTDPGTSDPGTPPDTTGGTATPDIGGHGWID